MESSSEQIKQMDKIFELNDSIMRPDIIDILRKYSKNGGDIQKASQALVQKYQGYPNMISIIWKILEKNGIQPQEIINTQINQSLKQLFQVDEMNKLIMNNQKVPKWVNVMLHDPFWYNALFDLAKENRGSYFLSYCINKICQYHPERITWLPPHFTSFNSFKNVVQAILKEMNDSNNIEKSIDKFITIISTDDMTLFYAALIFKKFSNNTISMISKRLGSKEKFFNKILLALDGCDETVSTFLSSDAKITKEEISQISSLNNISAHLSELIIQKISNSVKKIKDQELIEACVKCLLKLTKTELDDNQLYIAVNAFSFSLNSETRDEEKLNYVIQTIQIKCFVNILADIYIDQISDSYRQGGGSGNSPQACVLCEIAYFYPDKIQRLIKPLISKIQTARNSEALSEIFYVMKYFISLGFSKPTLKEYSKSFTGKITKYPADHREFLKTLFQVGKKFKNYNKAEVVFIDATSYIFSNEDLTSFLLPSGTRLSKAEQNALLEVKGFLNEIPENVFNDLPESSSLVLRSIIEKINEYN